jgi:Protein of unknown function (DUF1549)/Protein of unknown function (DUF1553)
VDRLNLIRDRNEAVNMRQNSPVFYFSVLVVATAIGSAEEVDSMAVIRRVDDLLVDAWRAAGLEPANTASDSEFARRTYLDLTGCIPRISETRRFLQSELPDRRARLIDELLKRPAHTKHLADVWARNLMPANSDLPDFILKEGFRNWLNEAFSQRRGFDEIATELLAACSDEDLGPTYYYMPEPVKPAELAGRMANSLLGIQLECAECHHDPFGDWKREDFWGVAAFFSDLRWGRKLFGEILNPHLEDFDGPELVIPGTNQVVRPRFLKGPVAEQQEGQTWRQVLAAWLTSAENPYFARSTTNKVWAMLFGEPLVESLVGNKVGKSELTDAILDELTAHFVTSGFDVQELIRVIANTRVYQATSKSQANAATDDLFHSRRLKSLSPEQLYASLSSVIEQPYDIGPREDRGLAFDLEKWPFLVRMDTGSAAAGYHGEVHQALALLNSKRIADATDWKHNPLLVSLLESRLNDEERVAHIFLATVTRTPTATEQVQFVAHLQASEAAEGRGQALADILWALLNTAEFALNR